LINNATRTALSFEEAKPNSVLWQNNKAKTMKNTLFKYQIGHQSTLLSAGSLYTNQQSAAREADQRLPNGFSAAC